MPASTPAGSATARATTSRTALWLGSAPIAARHSSINRSRSNTAPLLLMLQPPGDCFVAPAPRNDKYILLSLRAERSNPLGTWLLLPRRSGQRRRRRAVALLVEIVGAIEFEHQVAVDRRRVVGADATRQAFDHAVRVRAVEIGDRIAVGAAVVQHAMRGRQEPVVRPAPHHVAEIDQERAGDDRR